MTGVENGFLRRQDGSIAVTGTLTFETVPRFYEESAAWLAGGEEPLSVDLAGVARADSAGLALLLEWRQRSEAAGRRLVYVNPPEQLRHLARVSGLTQALGFDA
jgi:phospholipid transport system transporter-binding protein